MKASATILFVCMSLFFLCGSCSREEPPPPPPQKSKVVRPIKMPEEPQPVTEQVLGEKVATGEQQPITEEAGYYVAEDGDTLFTIAARPDTYADPLKWPLLYRNNIERLGAVLPTAELPGGLKLKVISPDEVAENLKDRPQQLWAVNVLSTTKTEKITPVALQLLTDGYLVYITRATIKGKQWLRLRVGFFTEHSEADTEGKKIMATLQLADSWVAKVGPEEREQFGGY